MLNHYSLPALFYAKGSDSGYQMKREMLSPAYTTNFDELPVAIA
ncbi:TPA: DUF4113 domain-containing protein [Providencia alcalifaciens]